MSQDTQKLIDQTINLKKTMLGVGPMSKNCVDSTIELSDQYNTPIMLIPSRRQIDSKKQGSGYSNNWSTEDFSKYVKKICKKKKIILCRDHGGPWQNNFEIKNNLTLKQAMKSAKKSFEVDIDSGVSVIHIDPSITIKKKLKVDHILERVYELYEHCYAYSKKKNKKILFEIGTEEQSGSTSTFEEIEYFLEKLKKFYYKYKIPKATFMVIQCGTKVMETKNIGSFEYPLRIINEVPVEIQLPKTIEICKKYDVYMKEHNGDYLSNKSLMWHPRLGIHAVNVAPEFGVTETRSLIRILKNLNLKKLVNEFLEISYNSRKWEKWVIDENKINDYDKSILSGHYVLSTPEVKEIIKEASKNNKNFINNEIKKDIKKSIKRYLYYFKLIKNKK
tara:strand:+ start:196 stop:1365 length:1170 start_codon:yes stop_codon:yes gene_type:complete